MATQSNGPSEVAREYANIDLGEPFEFERRLSNEEDDPLYDQERVEISGSDDSE